MKLYKIFGYTIESEYEMDGYLPSSDTPDIRIISGQVPDEIDNPYRWCDGFQVSDNECIIVFSKFLKCHISNGNLITIELIDPSMLVEVKLFTQSVALSIALMQRGQFCLHANAMIYRGKCVLITGESGAGKSSLSLALSQLGGKVLSDDMVRIEKLGDDMLAYSSYPSMKIWQEQADFHKMEVEEKNRIYKDQDKFFVNDPKYFVDGRRSVDYIIALTPDAESGIEVKQVSMVESMKSLVNNTFRYGMVIVIGIAKEHFAWVSNLIASTTVYDIHREADVNTIEAQVAFVDKIIEEDV